MKKFVVCTVMLFLALSVSSRASAAGAALDFETFQMTLPHMEAAGQRLHVVLDYVPGFSDGLYWTLNTLYPTSVAAQCGGTLDGNLNINEVCILVAGYEIKVNLEFVWNPPGHEGAYWKLASPELKPCVITHVAGPGVECVDFGIVQCTAGCNGDLGCILGCADAIGFQLAVQYTNSTGADLDCIIPPGTIFKPDDKSFQPMLMVHKDAFHVPAGSTQTFCVDTFCLDSALHIPEELDPYLNGGGTASSCMVEIVKYIYGKTLGSNTSAVQDIVWDCADNGTITGDQRAFLQGL